MAKTPESGGWGRFDLRGYQQRLVKTLRSTVLDRSPTAQLYDADGLMATVARRGGVTARGASGQADFVTEGLGSLRKESRMYTEALLGNNADMDIHISLNQLWRRFRISHKLEVFGIQLSINSAVEMQLILRDAYVSGFESAIGAGNLLEQFIQNVTTELYMYVERHYGVRSEELRKLLRKLVVETVAAGAQKRNSRRIL